MSGESQTERRWANLSPTGRVRRALASLVAFLVAVHALALFHRVLPARATAALPAAIRPFGRPLERIAHWDMFRTMNETEQLSAATFVSYVPFLTDAEAECLVAWTSRRGSAAPRPAA